MYTKIRKLILLKFIKQKACQLFFWRELDLYYERDFRMTYRRRKRRLKSQPESRFQLKINLIKGYPGFAQQSLPTHHSATPQVYP